MAIIEELREEIANQKHLILKLQCDKVSAKISVRIREQDLKKAKKNLYQVTKAHRIARELLRKKETKLKTYSSKKRFWAKKNFGKVMEVIEND